jgi:expansin (peptidoglycan-binding protein)
MASSLTEILLTLLGVGCAPGDIDVSPAAFAQLADMAEGRVDVTWSS